MEYAAFDTSAVAAGDVFKRQRAAVLNHLPKAVLTRIDRKLAEPPF
jgi:hypothetical protein